MSRKAGYLNRRIDKIQLNDSILQSWRIHYTDINRSSCMMLEDDWIHFNPSKRDIAVPDVHNTPRIYPTVEKIESEPFKVGDLVRMNISANYCVYGTIKELSFGKAVVAWSDLAEGRVSLALLVKRG